MSELRQPKSSREKVSDYRTRMRRRGFRLVQFWVPDVRSAEFAAEAKRQSMAIAESPLENEDQDFIEWITDDESE
jgi:hypothetical protein